MPRFVNRGFFVVNYVEILVNCVLGVVEKVLVLYNEAQTVDICTRGGIDYGTCKLVARVWDFFLFDGISSNTKYTGQKAALGIVYVSQFE